MLQVAPEPLNLPYSMPFGQVEGLWVSAFGDFDKRKSSTPGAAKVRGVDF